MLSTYGYGGFMPYSAKEFRFQNTPVRVYDREGYPWFVAKDVCGVLEITNTADAVKTLEEDESSTIANPDGRNGGGKTLIISESGLYALIFKSRKPQAREFRRWVTSEVLPQIRRTGSYNTAPAPVRLSRYPFFNRPDCVEALAELNKAGVAKLLTHEEFVRIVFEESAPKKLNTAPRSTALDQFVDLNLSFVAGAYEKTIDVHERYLVCVGDEITRNKLTRYLTTYYPDIAVKQKKLDGYPVQVYRNVKLTPEPVKIGQPAAHNAPAIEQRN